MSRLVAYVFGLGTVAATLSPALRDPRADSYPLSTYPMFAARRGKPRLHFVDAVDGAGKRQRVAPELVASDEVMQAAASVRRAVAGGEGTMRDLCAGIAERVRQSGQYADARAIELVSAEFDPIGYFERGAEPEARTEHFRCAVTAP